LAGSDGEWYRAKSNQPVVTLRSTWWLLTAFALISTVMTVPVLVTSPRPMPLRVVTAVALGLTGIGLLIESRGYRARWWAIALESGTILLTGASLPVPDAAKTLLFAVVGRRGVCANSRTGVAAAVLASSVTFTLSVGIARLVFHDDRPLMHTFNSIAAMVVVPMTMRMLVEGLAARAAAERTTAETSATLRAILDASPVGLLLVDLTGVVRMCNRTTEQIFGCRTDQLVGRAVTITSSGGEDSGEIIPPVALTGHTLIDHEITSWRRRDGSRVDLTISTAPLPGLAGVVAVICDVTERRRLQEQLRRQALHDELTGLANRSVFMEHTALALASARERNRTTGVLLLDLDAFKTINDTLGHSIGDALLVEVADHLRSCVRAPDLLARLGGDEFAILLSDSGPAEASAVAEQVVTAFDRPIRLRIDDATTEVRVRVSLGAVIAEESIPSDTNALLRSADLAMYAAKRAGGHRWAMFEPAMQDQLRERVSLENALRHALSASELSLHYQPCVDLGTGIATTAEALMRWNSPDWGAVRPSQFVPIAEDTGLIIPIGRWAISEACRQCASWQRLASQPLSVAVNISVRQLADPTLIDDVAAALSLAELPPTGWC
jgi:diguanylate cyclase (GGDEF)-like protein/PAS domain S-box-containing protein